MHKIIWELVLGQESKHWERIKNQVPAKNSQYIPKAQN